MVFQLPYEYVDKSVTPWGGMRLMKEFLNKTNIEQQINLLDLPKPGMPKMAIDGLEMNPARNQENGSQQTVEPVWMSCPTGTPTAGRDDPPANGQNPHTCTDVPRKVGASGISRHRPFTPSILSHQASRSCSGGPAGRR